MTRRRKAEINKQEAPTSVRIPKEIRELLDKEAERCDQTRHWVVLEVLRKWFTFMTAKKKSDAVKGN